MQPNAFLSFLCVFRLEKLLKSNQLSSCREKKYCSFCTHENQIIGKENSTEYEDAKDVTSPLVVDPFRLETVLLLRLRSL